ncbi:MAG TPA: lipocalin family protein [Chitinophagaceae bacterium]
MKKVLFGLFSLVLLGTACKKSKDAPAITKENISGTYIVTAATMRVGSSPEADLLANMDACEKDDQYKLNLDGTFAFIDAGTQCSPPMDYTGEWSLTGNTITIDGETGTVTKFDGSNLEVTSEYTDSGMTFIIRTNYKKQ